MTVRQPRYSKEEFARRGDELYETQVRQHVEDGNYGKIVAIDSEGAVTLRLVGDLKGAIASSWLRQPERFSWTIQS